MALEDDANLAWWDERARQHPRTAMYRAAIDRLRAGGHALHDLELGEVGPVAGRRLLHLQCHIGTDTLSWARLGANVTGVDFSNEGLDFARRLATELQLPARFLHGDVQALDSAALGEYDIVFTSYGTAIWLRDLNTWARGIAKLTRAGGFFYIADGHPMMYTLDDHWSGTDPKVALTFPYFASRAAVRFDDGGGSYADRSLETTNNVTYEWPHSLAEIVNALIGAGLRIEFLNEHRHCVWRAFDGLERGDDELWRFVDELRDRIPMMFSLKAVAGTRRA